MKDSKRDNAVRATAGSKKVEAQAQQMRGIYLLPNLFTVGALFCGFYAIVIAMRQQYATAAIAIFIAMILDGLDGRIARLIHAQSDFGAQMDSLADMVSFGVAPALVLYLWSLHSLGKAGWLAAFVYAVCTALRLARFNVRSAHHIDKAFFQGLSTTASAGCVASLVWLCERSRISGIEISHIVLVLTILLSLLKVSMIAFRSFKDINFRGRVPFSGILLVVLVFVLVSFDPPDVLAVIFWGYALSGPLSLVYRMGKRRYRRNHKLKNLKK